MKHMIKDLKNMPENVIQAAEHNQALIYKDKNGDPLIAELVEDDIDHTGALYCSQMQEVEEDDGEGGKIKVKKEVILVPADAKIKKTVTFAGYAEVGTED